MTLSSNEKKLILLIRRMSEGEKLEIQKAKKLRIWKRHWMDLDEMFLDINEEC